MLKLKTVHKSWNFILKGRTLITALISLQKKLIENKERDKIIKLPEKQNETQQVIVGEWHLFNPVKLTG